MLVGITKLYYLCNQNKYITIMTAIELRAELFREMSPLLEGAWKDNRSAEEIISDIRES